MSQDLPNQDPNEDGGRKSMTDLESMIQSGKAEVEPIYYTPWLSTSSSAGPSGSGSSGNGNGHGSNGCNGHQKPKLKRGKVYRYKENNDFICFVAHDNVAYRPGDCVYIDSQRMDQPHFVAGIQNFKLTKRDQLNVLIKWYYRPCEIPETVYRTLVQDRHTDNNSTGVGCSSICLKDPIVQSRELFISDAVDTYPVSALRGKCIIYHLRDIGTTAKDTKKLTRDDSFFYVLGYNPENNRLASITGEIRIGSNHQARLPALKERVDDEQGRKTKISPDDDQIRESLCWMPESLVDNDILMYLRAARSMAIFTGMQNEGSIENGCSTVARDQTTQNAYNSLHKNSYETGQALDDLLKNPGPISPERKFTDDEIKKFIRGLKLYGKNFFKIRQELLAHKTTSQLIEFYYLWKKTPAAGNQRPRPRQRRPQTTILRRVKTNPGNSKAVRPASNEYMDLSSASENESDSDTTSDTKDLSAYICRHCYTTTSKNWHHGGKDKTLLCADCRLYFKKYGELRPVDRSRTPPPLLFTPVKESSSSNSSWPQDSSRKNSPAAGSFGGVKTRRSGKAATASAAATSSSRRKPLTPTADMEKACKTPPLLATVVEKKSPKSAGKGQKRKSSSNSGSETPAPSAAPSNHELSSSSSSYSSNLDESSHDNDSNPSTERPDASVVAVPELLASAAVDNDSPLSSPHKLVIAEFASPGGSPAVPVSRPPSPTPAAPPDAKKRKTIDNSVAVVPPVVEKEPRLIEQKETLSISTKAIDVALCLGEKSGDIVKTAIVKPVDEVVPSPNSVISSQNPAQTHSTVIKNYRPSVTTPIIQNMPLKHRIKEEHRSSPITTTANSASFGLSSSSSSNHHFCPISRPPMDVPPAPTTPVLRPSVTYANKNYANSLNNGPSSNRSTPTAAVQQPLPQPLDNRQNEEIEAGAFLGAGIDSRCLAPGMKEPEPKVDDTECHRSKNAIFRRHWYRGEQNSCARTDMVFSPFPDSKLAKLREEAFRVKAVPITTIKEEKKEKSPVVNQHHPRPPPAVQTLAPPAQASPYASPISGRASRSSPVEHSPVSSLPPPLLPPSNRIGPASTSTSSSTPKHLSQPSPSSSANPPLPPNRPPSPTSTPYLNRLSLFAKMVAGSNNENVSSKTSAAAAPSNEQRFDHHKDHENLKDQQQQKRRQQQEMLMQRDFDLASQGLKPSPAAPPLFSPAPQTPVGAGGPSGGPSTNALASAAAPPFLQATPFPGGPPAGFMFGMNPNMPPLTDPIALDRYVAGISAYQLQLERMFLANPSQQLRLEMDRVGACLAALSAAGVMTQHHTHSHTHSHTHLHIHPTTTTAGQSSSTSGSTSSSVSSVLAPSIGLPLATTSSALPSSIMTSSTAANSAPEPAPPTPGAPEPGPLRLNPFSNQQPPVQPPPALVPPPPTVAQPPFLGPPPLSAPSSADQFLLQQYAAALSRDPYALAAAAAAAAAASPMPPPGHHLPPAFSPYHPAAAAHNPLAGYNPAAAAAAFGAAAAGAFFMPPHPPPVGLEALAAERLQQLQAQEIQRRMMLDRDLALGQQHQNVALMQQNEMMRRLQQEGNVGGLMNMFNLANQGLLRPGASPFDKRM